MKNKYIYIIAFVTIVILLTSLFLPQSPVDYISPQREIHILHGDQTGGGHLYGAGKPCKSEFPQDWDEGEIIHHVKLIAANDNLDWKRQQNGYHVAETAVETVIVRVVKDRDNRQVITAYPLNTGRNPCPANDN